MGGGYILVGETKNYRWYLPYSCTNYPHSYRAMVVQHKKSGKEINVDDYFSESDKESHDLYLELGKALEELEKENAQRGNYKALEKDKIALGDMYRRMVKAEADSELWERRAREAEEIIRKMEESFRKITKKR